MAVALVTGAGIRIGKAIALQLAKAGFDIALHYNHSKAEAEQTVEEVTKLGVKACLIQANLTDLSDADELIAQASQLGDLQVLVNSAAIFPNDDSINSQASHWDSVMGLNLKAPLLLSQAFAKLKPKHAHIINILDNRVRTPAGDHLVYRMSKTGLWHLTECLAVELAPDIQVNGLALGAIMPPPGADDDHFKRMANHIPLKRTGSVKSVAEAVAFLVSQDFITGAVIPIDGGEFL